MVLSQIVSAGIMEETAELVSTETIAREAAQASRVVMMNEAHDGMLRSVRTREVGLQLLPVFHEAGVRVLALEALPEEVAVELNKRKAFSEKDYGGYLDQPDLRLLVNKALELGWAVEGYDVSVKDEEIRYGEEYWLKEGGRELSLLFENVQWRETVQAQKLAKLTKKYSTRKILVWAGNGHIVEGPIPVSGGTYAGLEQDGELEMMAAAFRRLTGIDPFTIDQTITVNWSHQNHKPHRLLEKYSESLGQFGHTAGFLKPKDLPYDAVIISTLNELE